MNNRNHDSIKPTGLVSKAEFAKVGARPGLRPIGFTALAHQANYVDSDNFGDEAGDQAGDLIVSLTDNTDACVIHVGSLVGTKNCQQHMVSTEKQSPA